MKTRFVFLLCLLGLGQYSVIAQKKSPLKVPNFSGKPAAPRTLYERNGSPVWQDQDGVERQLPPALNSIAEFTTVQATVVNYGGNMWVRKAGTVTNATPGYVGVKVPGPTGSYYERLNTGGIWQVDWFGAVGDSTTNDTSPINTAIAQASLWAAASNARIRLKFRDDGNYLTDGILVKSNVWLDFGKARILKRTDGGPPQSNSLIRASETQTNGSFYGTYRNIKISGGILDANGKTASNTLVSLLYQENLEIEGVTVVRYAGTWAMTYGGKNVTVRGCTVLGGSALFEDGIHFVHGKNLSVSDCYIESGDDAIAIGTDPTLYMSQENDGIENVTVTNCRVKSNRGYAISLYTPTDASSNYFIRNVTVTNVTGSGGVMRNGAIQINDKSAPALGSGRISNVLISNVTLSVGSTSHDDTNPVAITVIGAQQVKISDGTFALANAASPTLGLRWIGIINSSDINLENLSCPALTTREALNVTSSRRVRAVGLTAFQTSTATTAAVTVASSPVTTIESSAFLNVKSGQVGIDAGTGTTNSLYLRNTVIAHAAGASNSYAVNFSSSSLVYLTMTGNDFTGATGVIDGNSVNQKFPLGSVKSLASSLVKNNRSATYEGDPATSSSYDMGSQNFGYATATTPVAEFLGGKLGGGIVRFRRTDGVSGYYEPSITTRFNWLQSGSRNIFSMGYNGSIHLVVAGADVSTTPTPGVYASESGSGTNVSGAPLTSRVGSGTGNAAVNKFNISTPDPTTSGTATQPQSDKFVIDAGKVQEKFYTAAADPTASDIPAGFCQDWKNTTAGTIKRWCNDGGTLKSAAIN